MTAYLVVMGHWITSEWKLHSKLLAFSELEGSHSGENIGEELYEVLKKYGICHKVGIICVFCYSETEIGVDTESDIRQCHSQ